MFNNLLSGLIGGVIGSIITAILSYIYNEMQYRRHTIMNLRDAIMAYTHKIPEYTNGKIDFTKDRYKDKVMCSKISEEYHKAMFYIKNQKLKDLLEYFIAKNDWFTLKYSIYRPDIEELLEREIGGKFLFREYYDASDEFMHD